ncbi:hypothetical protein lerEdw1_011939 [Lerista edwardsae]|nr:hypothetical protein lerEdw1_011939 [Lerista edwardsae]
MASLHALAARLGGPEREVALPGCLATVQQISELFRDAAPREMADENIFQKLLQILRKASCEIDVACKDTSSPAHLDSCLLLLTECFRCLRNVCVQNANNQNTMRDLGLIDASVHLIQLLQKLETDLESLLTAYMIWDWRVQHRIILTAVHLIGISNNLTDALSRMLYPISTRFLINNNLLKCPKLVKAMYANMSNQERIILLELISQISEEKSVIGEEITTFLASCFEEKCQAVLRLASATNNEDEEALVTIRLLDVLCEMTSNTEQLECLQSCPNLLEVAINTLKLTHIAGKQTTNIFTMTHSASGKEEISHPAMGFKSHLIRLIGNLCYKNKVNQDKVRKTKEFKQ